jgi:hypothetical protein
VRDEDLDERLSTEHLLERIHDEAKQRKLWHFPRKSRRIGLISATAVLVLSGAAAAAISLNSSSVTNTTELACFSKASLHSTGAVVSLDANPVSTCATLMHWPVVAGRARGVLCVLSAGSLGAFPSTRKEGECQTLGLLDYDGHVRDVPAAAFQEAAQSYFAAHRCEMMRVARVEVAHLLRRFGVSNWRVRVTGSSAPGSCATLAVEPSKKTVLIVGIKF